MRTSDGACAFELIHSLENVIPEIIRGRDVSTMSAEELEVLLQPVIDILREVDPENLLNSTRVKNGGACIGNGKYVRTIHDQVIPFEEGIRYLHMRESENCFSAGIFIFPPGAVIPLHNHPGMAVLSRILYGNLELRTFDIINRATEEIDKERNTEQNGIAGWFFPKLLSTIRRQTKNYDSTLSRAIRMNGLYASENDAIVVSATEVTASWPKKANLHQFTAGSDGAAVLDVLIPPYDAAGDRDCTFYEKVERTNFGDSHLHKRKGEDNNTCWLLPKEQPVWFQCLAGHYNHLGDEVLI